MRMKNLHNLAVLGAVLAVSTPLAFADNITYTLGSYGSAGLAGYDPTVTVDNTAMEYVANDLVSTVAAIPATPSLTSITPVEATDLNNPYGIWGGPASNSTWVGISANAGTEDTSNPQYGYYEFNTTLDNIVAGNYNGDFTVLADDTTEVLLNGNVIVPFGDLGSNIHCADTDPTCLNTDNILFSDLSLPTDNTLTFIVEQAGTGPVGGVNDPSGVDFAATLTETPEPSSLILLGTGLLGAAGLFMRRRRLIA